MSYDRGEVLLVGVLRRNPGLAFAADSNTGAYTFDVSALPARGDDCGGPDGYSDLDHDE